MRREVGIAEARGERVLPVGGRERPHLCFVAPHIWPVFSRDPQLKARYDALVGPARGGNS